MDAQRCSKCLRDFTGLTGTADIGWIVELSSHARLEATFRFIPKQSVLAGLRGSLAAAALRDAVIIDQSISVPRKPVVVATVGGVFGACRRRVRVLVQRSLVVWAVVGGIRDRSSQRGVSMPAGSFCSSK